MEQLRRSPHLDLSSQQLKDGSIYLGQAFLGLAALAQIDSGHLAKTMGTMLSMAARQGETIEILDFSKLSDRLLSQSPNNPFEQPLTSSELFLSVQVLSYLCQQYQELIRRVVSLMEQMTKESKDPWQISLLKDYNQRLEPAHFSHLPHSIIMESDQWRGKILLDLLFYSSPYGQSRLWLRCTQPQN